MKVLELDKKIGIDSFQILDQIAREKVGNTVIGVSGNQGSPGKLRMHLTNVSQEAAALQLLKDMKDPSVSVNGLQISVSLGQTVAENPNDPLTPSTQLLNDSYTVVADPSAVKTIKVSLVCDQTTKAVELVIFEKTDGEYGNVPAGKRLLGHLKEYSLAANGVALVEV
jgi:hypothetical protein